MLAAHSLGLSEHRLTGASRCESSRRRTSPRSPSPPRVSSPTPPLSTRIAPTTSNGSTRVATACGSASGCQCHRSSSHAKNRRRRWCVTWSRMVPRSTGDDAARRSQPTHRTVLFLREGRVTCGCTHRPTPCDVALQALRSLQFFPLRPKPRSWCASG
jgi:hypothetical protein